MLVGVVRSSFSGLHNCLYSYKYMSQDGLLFLAFGLHVVDFLGLLLSALEFVRLSISSAGGVVYFRC